MNRTAFALAFALPLAGSLSWTAPVRAETCANDIDCKTEGTACGTQVCDYVTGMVCAAPSAANPGWCTVSTDCKCNNLGATCSNFTCTFLVPPADGGGGDSGSASSSQSSSSATKSSASSSATSSGSGSSTSESAGGSSSSGGCAAGFGPTPPWWMAALGLSALWTVRRRRHA